MSEWDCLLIKFLIIGVFIFDVFLLCRFKRLLKMHNNYKMELMEKIEGLEDRLAEKITSIDNYNDEVRRREFITLCHKINEINSPSHEEHVRLHEQAVAEYNRNSQSSKIKDGLKKAKIKGKKLGSPKSVITDEVVARIRELRSEGHSNNQIMSILNLKVPTYYGALKRYGI